MEKIHLEGPKYYIENEKLIAVEYHLDVWEFRITDECTFIGNTYTPTPFCIKNKNIKRVERDKDWLKIFTIVKGVKVNYICLYDIELAKRVEKALNILMGGYYEQKDNE